jgi:hypothetical protein
VTPVINPPSIQKKDISPIQTPPQNTPRTNNPPPVQPAVNQPDFTNFFGRTDPKLEVKQPEIKIETKPQQPVQVQPINIPQQQRPPPNNNPPPGMTKDFANFFGTNSGQSPTNPLNNAPKVGPTTPPPVEEKKPE